ncbi:MAG: peptidase M28, partial [Bacteroidia bacterium]|nr:peptidase M28 [Bacteroidia bacterium]
MKTLAFLSAFLLVGACATQSHKEKIQSIKNSVQIIEQKDVMEYASTITINELKSHLYFLASDRFEGRSSGSNGQKLAAEFLKRYYTKESISAPNGGDYFQSIPGSYFGNGFEDTENVYA